jgi:hypothetical protein
MKAPLAVLFCLAAVAQDKPAAQQSESSRTRTDIGTAVTDPVVDYYDSIADYFRQSRRAVELISRKGIPDEEIPAVLLIARSSSASPNQVIAARKKNLSWKEIAEKHGVKVTGEDFVTAANIQFLSAYHGRKPEEVREMREKGATFVAINQEFRREGGTSAVPKEEPRFQ